MCTSKFHQKYSIIPKCGYFRIRIRMSFIAGVFTHTRDLFSWLKLSQCNRMTEQNNTDNKKEELQRTIKLSRSCWCAQAGHQCLCVLNTWLVVCLVPCAPMSIVCPLPSCYLSLFQWLQLCLPRYPRLSPYIVSLCLQSCSDPLSFVCPCHVS